MARHVALKRARADLPCLSDLFDFRNLMDTEMGASGNLANFGIQEFKLLWRHGERGAFKAEFVRDFLFFEFLDKNLIFTQTGS